MLIMAAAEQVSKPDRESGATTAAATATGIPQLSLSLLQPVSLPGFAFALVWTCGTKKNTAKGQIRVEISSDVFITMS